MNESQSRRMENELAALRELFNEAKENEDAARMISLSRVIIQHEKEISKQRLQEGITVDRDAIGKMVDEAVQAMVKVAKGLLPKELYDRFVDDLLVELSTLWEK